MERAKKNFDVLRYHNPGRLKSKQTIERRDHTKRVR